MAGAVLVTGAGSFISHHLVKYLVARGDRVRGTDLKHPKFEPSPASEFELADLRQAEACLRVTRDVSQVYHWQPIWEGPDGTRLSRADRAQQILPAEHLDPREPTPRLNGVRRLLFSSSASVYPLPPPAGSRSSQRGRTTPGPADPQEGYGLQNLYMEKLCQYYSEDFGLETRIARIHNVYGPLGRFEGGRKKAPAAILRRSGRSGRSRRRDRCLGGRRQTDAVLHVRR